MLHRSTRYRLETPCRLPANSNLPTRCSGPSIHRRERETGQTTSAESYFLWGAKRRSGWFGAAVGVELLGVKGSPPHAFQRILHMSTSLVWGRTWGSSRGILPCLGGGNSKRAMSLRRARGSPHPHRRPRTFRAMTTVRRTSGIGLRGDVLPGSARGPRWRCEGAGRLPLLTRFYGSSGGVVARVLNLPNPSSTSAASLVPCML